MRPDDVRQWERSLRKAPLLPEGDGTPVTIPQTDLFRLVPHRPPFLLIDTIEAVDLHEKRIRGKRTIDPRDPVFDGHFPGDPVYPGVLQIEIVGQLALCLASLVAAGKTEARDVALPVNVRASRVHQAVFAGAVLPGDVLTIHAGLVEHDELAASAAGQIYKGTELRSISIVEVFFLD